LELYQDLSAKENLTFFSKIKGIRESDKRINDLMKRLKLSGREDDLVKAYSSGMKQRLKYVFAMLGQPDDDLDIETSDDFELSFGYINTGFRMKLNLYRIYFDNKSYRIENPAMADKPGYDYKGRRYVTVGKAVYEGIEFSSNIQLSKNLDLGLSVTSMENAWGDDISEEAQSELGIEEGKIEPGTPQFMLSGVLNYIRGPFFMSASARYNKDYYILPGNDYIALEYDVTNDVSTHSAAVLDDWAVVDLIIGWNQKFMGVDLSASFHLNNLFNEDFYQIGNEYGLIPGPERNAMLNLTIGL
jgi:outer membrane receptor protein involved in Fe transport